MKLHLIIAFAILGTALAMFPPIPEYTEETSPTEDDIAASSTTQATDTEKILEKSVASTDLNTESQTPDEQGRKSRATFIPVYLYKSKVKENVRKNADGTALKEPVKVATTPTTDKNREEIEILKTFATYAPVFIHQFENPSSQGVGFRPAFAYPITSQIYDPISRPDYRPNYRPNTVIYRPSFALRPNDEYFPSTYTTYNTEYGRDFYSANFNN